MNKQWDKVTWAHVYNVYNLRDFHLRVFFEGEAREVLEMTITISGEYLLARLEGISQSQKLGRYDEVHYFAFEGEAPPPPLEAEAPPLEGDITSWEVGEAVNFDSLHDVVCLSSWAMGVACHKCEAKGLGVTVHTRTKTYDVCFNCLNCYELLPVYEQAPTLRSEAPPLEGVGEEPTTNKHSLG